MPRQNSVWREKATRSEESRGTQDLLSPCFGCFFFRGEPRKLLLLLIIIIHLKQIVKMAAEVMDDHEMREAQRDYLYFLDDDVSLNSIVPCFGC